MSKVHLTTKHTYFTLCGRFRFYNTVSAPATQFFKHVPEADRCKVCLRRYKKKEELKKRAKLARS